METKDNDSEVIDIGFGFPDRFIHTGASFLQQASQDILESEESCFSAMYYGPKEGPPQFRDELAKFLTQQYGDEVKSSNLMATCGATVSLHLITTLLFNHNHVIFLEDPTFHRILGLWSDLSRVTVPITLDIDGINIEELDEKLTEYCGGVETSERYPYRCMIYVMTVCHNPSTIAYSQDKCRRLVSLARKHDALLVGDDVYNLLTFDHTPPHRLFYYDSMGESQKGHVISVASFTKFFSPGIRLGWIEAPTEIVKQLRAMDVFVIGACLNHYMAVLMEKVITRGLLAQFINDIKIIYKEKRDIMSSCLRQNMPDSCHFTLPDGGFFIWLALPENINSINFAQFVEDKYGVFVIPGQRCSKNGNFSNYLRLCYTQCSKENVQTGCRRLGAAFEAYSALQQK